MPTAIASGLMVSTCTVQQPDGLLIGAGQPSGNWVDVIADVQCMDAPDAAARPAAREKKSVPDIQSMSLRHVLLAGFYGDVIPWGNEGARPQLRAIVTGPDGVPVTYELVGMESDSQQIMTRLVLHLVTE